jgi:hypothetical protein
MKFNYGLITHDSEKNIWLVKIRYTDNSGATLTKTIPIVDYEGAMARLRFEIGQFPSFRVEAFL